MSTVVGYPPRRRKTPTPNLLWTSRENPEERSGVGVRKAVRCCTQPRSGNSCEAPDVSLYRRLSFRWIHRWRGEGGIWCLGNSLSSIRFCPGLRPGEDIPASPYREGKTRETAFTSYKSSSTCVEQTGVEQTGYILNHSVASGLSAQRST